MNSQDASPRFTEDKTTLASDFLMSLRGVIQVVCPGLKQDYKDGL